MLTFTLPESGRVSLVIYNQYGQKVHQVVEAVHNAGYHSYEVSRGDLGGSGAYYYQLQHSTGGRTTISAGRMVLIR